MTSLSVTNRDFDVRGRWNSERPHDLVVCCSDGRLQKCIDEFLSVSLGIVDYDRMYAPGGPGLLSRYGAASDHAHQHRSDFSFLLEAHDFSRVILLFHGAAPDASVECGCAYYRSILPGAAYDQIIARHDADRKDVEEFLRNLRPSLEIEAFRAEVAADHSVRFVALSPE